MKAGQETVALRLDAAPVGASVQLPPGLSGMLKSVLYGWTISPGPASPPPAVRIAGEGGGDLRICEAAGAPEYTVSDPVDAICGLLAGLLKHQANAAPGHLCLHSAAAVFAGRAVLFPAGFRAGKSTLAAVLAARGVPVVGDDAVFVSPASRQVVSVGVAPRMRLPLPRDIGDSSRAFIGRTMKTTGRRYGYLDLPEPVRMSNGQAVSLGAVVFLRRTEDGAPALAEVSKSDALRATIFQNFARRSSAGDILLGLSGMIAECPTLELSFASAEEAADVLIAEFADWSPHDAVAESVDPLPLHAIELSDPEWRIKPGLVESDVDGSRFVADGDTGRIVCLNSTAAAIWRLLCEGEGRDSIAKTLTAAFPDIDAGRIGRDVGETIALIREIGLLLTAGEYDRVRSQRSVST